MRWLEAGFFEFVDFGLALLEGPGLALCVEGCCCFPGPAGCGGFVVWVVVVLGVVEVVFGDVVDEGDVVDDVELEVELGVDVVLGAVVVVGAAVHDSVTFCTGPVTGSLIDDTGVPGGTSTVKLRTWPLTSVTVITHVSADADGSAAMPVTAKNEPAVASATTSFRLLNTVA